MQSNIETLEKVYSHRFEIIIFKSLSMMHFIAEISKISTPQYSNTANIIYG